MSGILIVTGASRGIGAATARLAAKRGYAVCVNALARREAAEAVADEIVGGGGRAIAVMADIGSEKGVSHLFAETDRRLGRLTALVNNAGVAGASASLLHSDAAEMRRVFEVNALGTLLCCREAVRRMARSEGGLGGAIVNLSSRAAQGGGGSGLLPYAASKAAVEAMTVGLARQVAAEGIRVNAVSPGVIATEMNTEGANAAELAARARDIPLGRLGTPEEVAETILWLLSPAASYVTGAVLAVAGAR